MTGPVVIGLDGSRESLEAAQWGAREALLRRLPVVLLHSWVSQPMDPPIAQNAKARQEYARKVLEEAAALVRERRPGLEVETCRTADPAVEALVGRSEGAATVVVGSRGHGALAGFVLGSVSLPVVGRAVCPVVVVRAGRGAAAERPLRNEVVVGVQEPSPGADPLLEFAFASARAHGCGVRAVRAWCPPDPFQYSLSPASLASGEGGAKGYEGRLLAAAVQPWRERFPSVPVEEHLEVGAASEVVLSAASRGCLLVVGRRAHRPRLSFRLGPVAHAALHHAPCPVAVVPHG